MALDTLQPLCYAVITPLFIITVITTVIRIYIRLFIKQFGWDDWASAALLFLNAGLQAILYIFLKYGGGLHVMEVQTEHPEYIPKLLKGLFAIEIYYIYMNFHIKMNFLLFYMRLSHYGTFRLAIYITMALVTVCSIAIELLYCFQCIPLEAFWNPTKYPGTVCLDSSITYYGPYVINLTLDIVVLVLPIQTVWNLQMTLRRKLQVLSVICTGGASVLVSALRLLVLLEFATSPDFTWALGKMIIVSAFEIDVAIIASNMPSMKALWSKWRGGTLTGGSSERSKGYSHQLSDMPEGSGGTKHSSQSAAKNMGWSHPKITAADNVSEQSLVGKGEESGGVVVTHTFRQETRSAPPTRGEMEDRC